jgi:hypothetical protein
MMVMMMEKFRQIFIHFHEKKTKIKPSATIIPFFILWVLFSPKFLGEVWVLFFKEKYYPGFIFSTAKLSSLQ